MIMALGDLSRHSSIQPRRNRSVQATAYEILWPLHYLPRLGKLLTIAEQELGFERDDELDLDPGNFKPRLS